MTADITVTTTAVTLVHCIEKFTGPTNEAVNPGQCVRFHTTTGHLTPANANDAAEARVVGISVGSANVANIPVTAIRKGIISLGNALSSLNYDAAVYLSNTDGLLSDGAGSVSTVVGRVIPSFAAGSAVPDKLLLVDL